MKSHHISYVDTTSEIETSSMAATRDSKTLP